MDRKASTVKSPRILIALTLTALIIASAVVSFSMSGTSPTINAQMGVPGKTIVLNPRNGAIIGSGLTVVLDPADGAIISISTPLPRSDDP
jgi:hypothetical protein